MSIETKEKTTKGLKEMKRREFLKLTRDVGISALVAGAGAAWPTQTKNAAMDLDWADYYATELRRQLNQGKVSYVLEEAGRYYNMLKQAQFPVKVTRAAEIQIRFGILLASAQEGILPWFERAAPTISTYNRIEKEVLSKLPLRKYSSYHIHLLARRAPLYREIGDFGKSLEQFTSALEDYRNEAEDIRLLVELYYSRAHVWAVLGDERRWRIDLDQAKRYAQRANLTRSRDLFGLITYTEGEGYKRLAYNKRLDLSESQRIWYATQGLACFGQSHLEESQWAGHTILNGVAESQCMILIDPNEAIRQAERLRIEAQCIYPAIVQKIDHTIATAQKRLQSSL